jgi:hypothetical protein
VLQQRLLLEQVNRRWPVRGRILMALLPSRKAADNARYSNNNLSITSKHQSSTTPQLRVHRGEINTYMLSMSNRRDVNTRPARVTKYWPIPLDDESAPTRHHHAVWASPPCDKPAQSQFRHCTEGSCLLTPKADARTLRVSECIVRLMRIFSTNTHPPSHAPARTK